MESGKENSETEKRNKGEVKNDQWQLGNQNPNESNIKVDMDEEDDYNTDDDGESQI